MDEKYLQNRSVNMTLIDHKSKKKTRKERGEKYFSGWKERLCLNFLMISSQLLARGSHFILPSFSHCFVKTLRRRRRKFSFLLSQTREKHEQRQSRSLLTFIFRWLYSFFSFVWWSLLWNVCDVRSVIENIRQLCLKIVGSLIQILEPD